MSTYEARVVAEHGSKRKESLEFRHAGEYVDVLLLWSQSDFGWNPGFTEALSSRFSCNPAFPFRGFGIDLSLVPLSSSFPCWFHSIFWKHSHVLQTHHKAFKASEGHCWHVPEKSSNESERKAGGFWQPFFWATLMTKCHQQMRPFVSYDLGITWTIMDQSKTSIIIH